MPEDRNERISRLSQRFRTHATGRKPESKRVRERQSFYLDAELVSRLDQTHKEVSHQLYPTRVNKSTFLETLLEYGLEHLNEVKAQLKQAEGYGETSEE
jgi:hypothetical protein